MEKFQVGQKVRIVKYLKKYSQHLPVLWGMTKFEGRVVTIHKKAGSDWYRIKEDGQEYGWDPRWFEPVESKIIETEKKNPLEFQAGQKVKIAKELIRYPDDPKVPDDPKAKEKMLGYLGQEVTIIQIINDPYRSSTIYKIFEDGGEYFWDARWLEPVSSEVIEVQSEAVESEFQGEFEEPETEYQMKLFGLEISGQESTETEFGLLMSPEIRKEFKMFSVYLKEKGFKEPEDQIYYILAKKGLYMVKKTAFFTVTTLVMEAKTGKELGFLQDHSSGLKLSLPKKIPSELIKKTVAFFRKVNREFGGSESIVIAYWDETKKEYELLVPEQEVGPGTIPNYANGANPKGMLRVGTIHCHGNGGAFHSGIDDKDEKHDDGFHLTIGNVGTIPSFSCSVVCDGERFKLEFEDIVETIEETFDVDDWMKKVKRQVITPAYTKVTSWDYSAGYGAGAVRTPPQKGTHSPVSQQVTRKKGFFGRKS